AGFVVVLVSVLVGAMSLVLRFRRARGTERQQLRWLALAAALGAGLLLVALVAGSLGRDAVVLASLALCVALLPLTTGAAILRYRLYDIDRIVSRTLPSPTLPVLLGLGSAAVVRGLGRLLGQDSSLVVAAATLAVAAAFQPARRRVQGAADGRFNRRRPDAARTIEGLGARAAPPPRPGGGRRALQPPPPRRGQDHRRLRRPAPGPGRPGRAPRRAAGGGRPDHAADPGLPLAPVHPLSGGVSGGGGGGGGGGRGPPPPPAARARSRP